VAIAPLWKGRPVTALVITIASVFAAAYVAMVPAPVETEPPRLIMEAPPQETLLGTAAGPSGAPVATQYEEGVAATGAVTDSEGLAATP
jgi:hypothetical protein